MPMVSLSLSPTLPLCLSLPVSDSLSISVSLSLYIYIHEHIYIYTYTLGDNQPLRIARLRMFVADILSIELFATLRTAQAMSADN